MPLDEITAMKDWLPLPAGTLVVPKQKPGVRFHCTARFPYAIELASSDARAPFEIITQGDIIVNRKVIRFAVIEPLNRNTLPTLEKSKCLKIIGQLNAP